MMIRFCVICGKPLTDGQKILCSNKECHRVRENECQYERRHKDQDSKFCIICGKELIGRQRVLCSDEECHRKRQNERSRKYCQNNPEKIKEHRQNNREKIRKSKQEYYQNNREKKLEYSREYHRNNREKGNKRSLEYYQNNVEKMRKQSHEYYHNNREKRAEHYQNNAEEISERNRKKYRRDRGLPEDADLHKESSIEIIIKKWLQESGIEFVQQYSINFENSTWTHVDFFIEPNICLYVDGDYWHSLSEVQERDIRINKILEEMGHNVVRLTETEILEGNRSKLMQCLGVDKNG